MLELDASASEASISVDRHVPNPQTCVWFGSGSERDRFTDSMAWVRSTMLALSLLQFVFGLLINCTVSDKTSNYANVAAVSGANLSSLVNFELGGGGGRNLPVVLDLINKK